MLFVRFSGTLAGLKCATLLTLLRANPDRQDQTLPSLDQVRTSVGRDRSPYCQFAFDRLKASPRQRH